MKSKKRLSMHKALERLITDLNDRLVVVEGKNDVRALERIGVRAAVITFDALHKLKNFRGIAVILADYDRAGEIKARKAEAVLIERGIKFDPELRERFRRIFGALTIEDVPHIFKELCRKGGR